MLTTAVRHMSLDGRYAPSKAPVPVVLMILISAPLRSAAYRQRDVVKL